jgi:ABC-type Fe3+-hydroxamate transport system substrate-binding protein
MHQRSFADQLGRSIAVNYPPKRIISIVPSQTELLFDLGLDAEIIGITKFCSHPRLKVEYRTNVGGTKKLDLELIRQLKPDLIIGNKEENEQSQIETLMQEFSVWMSDINDLEGALAMITGIGTMIDRGSQAERLATQISLQFDRLSKSADPLKVAYLIWQKPYMIAGKNTFIDDMLQRCGFVNTFNAERYPQLSEDALRQGQPDVIMLSSEPYPFKEKHLQVMSKICPLSKVILVDGEMFSWYGSRLLKAVSYFEQLITSLTNF